MGCGASSSAAEPKAQSPTAGSKSKDSAAAAASSSGECRELPMLTGKPMPVVGLGTWQSPPGAVEAAVGVAIDAGYRHIDTARAYMNEGEIGNALESAFNAGKVKREEIFIVTKLMGPCCVPARVREQALVSLKLLKLEYLDLLLIHAPMVLSDENFDSDGKTMANFFPMNEKGLAVLPIDPIETYKEMEKLVDEGLVKAIGVSNYNLELMKSLWENSRIKPSNLQNESHVWNQDNDMINFCKEKGITYSCYSPLGSPQRWGAEASDVGVLMEDPTVCRIANDHNKTPAHVLLKFLLQRGLIVLPKSVTPERVKANIEVYDFTLSDSEMEELKAANKSQVLLDPSTAMASIDFSKPNWPTQ